MARLTLLGPRALPALFAALPASGPALRLGALEVFERLGDPRARPEVQALCRDADSAVALRALELLPALPDAKAVKVAARVLAQGPADRREAAVRALATLHAAGWLEAVEPLLDLLLDDQESEGLRLCAFDALLEADPRALSPVVERLSRGRDAVARKAAARRTLLEPGAGRLTEALRRLTEANLRADEAVRLGAEIKLAGPEALPVLHAALDAAIRPLEIEVLADALAAHGSPASIPAASRALQRLSSKPARGAEEAEGSAAAAARLHLVLAALKSRVAHYDLRERLEARPLRAAEGLLEAARLGGDLSLVPALARLHAREAPLRPRVERAFAAIAAREGLPRGSARDLSPPDRKALDALKAAAAGPSRPRAARPDTGRGPRGGR
jgi:hypothetical protein